eukprot:COSAG06_NODE_10068_length_1751_cov_1.736588_2_plen_33_part_01
MLLPVALKHAHRVAAAVAAAAVAAAAVSAAATT